MDCNIAAWVALWGVEVAIESVVVGAPIGSGAERVVYLHPAHDDRVIKINRDASRDRNVIDHAYLSAIGTIPLLPKMYGWVETQLGHGLMFEHIRDADGRTSIGLTDALRKGRMTIEEGHSLLREALVTLRKNGIILHDDENVNNFLVQDVPLARRLILVDGFGPFEMTAKARLRTRFRWLAREKTLRCSFNLLAAFQKEIEKVSHRQKVSIGAEV